MELKKILSLWLKLYYNEKVVMKTSQRERQVRSAEIPYKKLSSPQETSLFSVSQWSQGSLPTLCMHSFVDEFIMFAIDWITGSTQELVFKLSSSP